MTPNQRKTVDQLVSEGFRVILAAKDIVRVTKGADKRLVRADGSQRRGNHIERGVGR